MTSTMTTAPYLDNSFRVGRASLADEALYIHASQTTNFGQDCPDYPDWTYLDCGSYRVVMLHVPTQVVYKVPFADGPGLGYGDDGTNTRAELENFRRMLVHPQYAPFVPEHEAHQAMYDDRWVTVMAMAYLGGQPGTSAPAPPALLHEAADHVGCGDSGLRNVRYDDGRWYLIDAGGTTEGDEWDWIEYAGAGCNECNPARARRMAS